MIKKIRPSVLLGIVVLGLAVWLGLHYQNSEVAVGATVGIAGLLPKLVESEEKTNGQ